MTIYENNNAASLIFCQFSESPEKVFISCDGKDLTGKQIIELVIACQSTFIAAGLKKGASALVFTGRSSDFWIDILALWGLGACAVPVEPEIEEARLQHMLTKSEPVATLGTPDKFVPLLSSLISTTNTQVPDRESELICTEMLDSETAVILFTSGSTGEPKGVVLSHSSVRSNGLGTADVFNLQACRKLFAPVPFRFVSALSHFVATLYVGVNYAGTEERFLQGEFITRLIESGADAVGGSPMQARWIAEDAKKLKGSIKWIMSSGDNLPVQVINQLHDEIPNIAVVAAYGLTEVAGRFCILDPQLSRDKAGSVGRPISGLTVSVRDDKGEKLGIGNSGEIYVKGACVFEGYINDREKTMACLSNDGFATGDIGYIDNDNMVHLSGRTDDVFKSGGIKVSTLPITAALFDTGRFKDVAVLQHPDQILGSVPIAFYILSDDAVFHKGEILRELRDQLPKGHLPKQFIEVEAIPRTGSGKVRRMELRSAFPLKKNQ